MKNIIPYLIFSIALALILFKVDQRSEIISLQKEQIHLQDSVINILESDLNLLVHYPESQKSESIIYRVRLNAAISEAMIIIDSVESK